jgi:hypothetical protein
VTRLRALPIGCAAINRACSKDFLAAGKEARLLGSPTAKVALAGIAATVAAKVLGDS